MDTVFFKYFFSQKKYQTRGFGALFLLCSVFYEVIVAVGR